MTTRRDVLAAAVALPCLIAPPLRESIPPDAAPSTFTPTWTAGTGFDRPPCESWLLTRQQMAETPHWGAPSVVPNRLDVIAYHHCLPRLDRVQLTEELRAKYRHPFMVERYSEERDALLVVVGEYEYVRALERSWGRA